MQQLAYYDQVYASGIRETFGAVDDKLVAQ